MVTLLVPVPGSPSSCTGSRVRPDRSDGANCDGGAQVKERIRETNTFGGLLVGRGADDSRTEQPMGG